MSLWGKVGRGLGIAKNVAEDARQVYFAASAKAVALSNSRLDDLSRMSRILGPQLRHLVDERIGELQHRLDELNCSLAEKALPSDRRERVKEIDHSASADRKNLRVVASADSKPSVTPPKEPTPLKKPRARRPASAKTADAKTTAEQATEATSAQDTKAGTTARKSAKAKPKRSKKPAAKTPTQAGPKKRAPAKSKSAASGKKKPPSAEPAPKT